jgi:hypothetical protein
MLGETALFDSLLGEDVAEAKQEGGGYRLGKERAGGEARAIPGWVLDCVGSERERIYLHTRRGPSCRLG